MDHDSESDCGETQNLTNHSETEFERELKVFGSEVEEAIQCFYAWLTIRPERAARSAREHR